MSFAKLDSGIVNSTIWVQPHDVLRLWVWFLSQADAHGVVRTAAPALAHACMVPLDRTREILVLLESPDPDSRSDVDDGRRIEKVSGGWRIVNYRAYRERVSADEKRENDRLRIAEKRSAERAESQSVAERSEVSQPVAEVAQAEVEVDIEAKKQKQQPVRQAARFDEFWAEYPNKKGKADAKRTWSRKGLDAKADDLIAHVRLMAATDDGWLRGFVPMGSTYLNGDRWEDVPAPTPMPVARAGPAAVQPVGKQMQGVMALEGMIRERQQRLAGNPDSAGVAAAGLLVDGPDSGG